MPLQSSTCAGCGADAPTRDTSQRWCTACSSSRRSATATATTSGSHRRRRVSSVCLLGLLSCATVLVGAFAAPRPQSQATSATRTASKIVGETRRGGGASVLAAKKPASGDGEASSSFGGTSGPLNGVPVAGTTPNSINVNNVVDKRPATKTIVEPGGFTDRIVDAAYVAETNLPTDVGQFRLRAYRMDPDAQDNNVNGFRPKLGSEPCVIYCADKPPFGGRGGERGGRRDLPVRIHDQCFTSEVFRSQRCDCKEQLKMSLEYIRDNGGAIIYLQQEGRGIGLANKVAAYALQDVGMDTVDANTHLGFPEDARRYGVVPSLLADMGIDSIRLMTNNPRKIQRLEALGVDVTGTIPVVVPKMNRYNRKYIETKVERMNHKNFGDMIGMLPVAPAENVLAPTTTTNGQADMSPAELAAATVASALEMIDADDPTRSGVTASATDGYCFGRRSVEEAIAAMKRGEIVVVVDDENRENEGDFIMAADMATPEKMAEFVRYSSGVVCIGMEGERMDELQLPSMCKTNEDPKGTAFSVSVDATKEHGITTGISATDRARTSLLLASPKMKAVDFHRPGHIFPLRARENGVLARDGHTEAAVDLSRLAGRSPVGLLCEIVSEENPVEMARLPELKRFCKRRGYVLTSIVDLAQYRRDTESVVES